MSTASVVPETRGLTGDDARQTLRSVGWGRLAKDSFRRLRVSDGFSHARSLAFMTSLVAIQGVIATVGLARVLDKGGVSAAIDATLRRAIPGPAGRVFTTAVTQAHHMAAEHRYTALYVGAIGAIFTGTVAMGQLERGLNRLYGVEQDRPTAKKYALAFVFTLSVGALIAAAFVCLALGRDLFPLSGNSAAATAWSVARWPLGFGLIGVAVTAIFRWSPRRVQPDLSWLAFGSVVSVVLWALVTAGLGLFFRSSSTFGATYGPLAGVVALLMWSLLSSIAVLYGAALAAQLETVRAGQRAPQDPDKVAESDPASDPSPAVAS
ncbi:MAG TPA: YihY/virulence factor BrkB family protein [Acidimicrobiales bacterium]|nr:YihY/virulence factor BrkB family protein [Acidimicrobiales bacterium]